MLITSQNPEDKFASCDVFLSAKSSNLLQSNYVDRSRVAQPLGHDLHAGALLGDFHSDRKQRETLQERPAFGTEQNAL